MGKLRPAGHMRPSRAFCAAREHFLKLCRFKINTTRGLTRRKRDGVLKKKVIASPLDGKCVRAYNARGACYHDVMCANEFVIERYYIFHSIANMGFWFFGDDETGPADESKRTKRVEGWSRQIMGGRLLLFAILLLCEITTSFV